MLCDLWPGDKSILLLLLCCCLLCCCCSCLLRVCYYGSWRNLWTTHPFCRLSVYLGCSFRPRRRRRRRRHRRHGHNLRLASTCSKCQKRNAAPVDTCPAKVDYTTVAFSLLFVPQRCLNPWQKQHLEKTFVPSEYIVTWFRYSYIYWKDIWYECLPICHRLSKGKAKFSYITLMAIETRMGKKSWKKCCLLFGAAKYPCEIDRRAWSKTELERVSEIVKDRMRERSSGKEKKEMG